jgi:hypothetical protein
VRGLIRLMNEDMHAHAESDEKQRDRIEAKGGNKEREAGTGRPGGGRTFPALKKPGKERKAREL